MKIPCKPIGTQQFPDGRVFILVQVPGGSTITYDPDKHEGATDHDRKALCVYQMACYFDICLTATAYEAKKEWW